MQYSSTVCCKNGSGLNRLSPRQNAPGRNSVFQTGYSLFKLISLASNPFRQHRPENIPHQRICARRPRWQENRLFSVNLKVLDTQVGSETWKKCKIGLFRPEEIKPPQNGKSAATQCSFYIILKDFTDDNIGFSSRLSPVLWQPVWLVPNPCIRES